jgi:hypothetical protein
MKLCSAYLFNINLNISPISSFHHIVSVDTPAADVVGLGALVLETATVAVHSGSPGMV